MDEKKILVKKFACIMKTKQGIIKINAPLNKNIERSQLQEKRAIPNGVSINDCWNQFYSSKPRRESQKTESRKKVTHSHILIAV